MAVFDKHGMYEIIENLYIQVERGYESSKNISLNPEIYPEISKIIIAGVGGSILCGHILKQYLKNYELPVFVVEDYKLPNFVNKNSLVFIVSYSGNSDEAIHMYKDGLKKECQIITIGSGGKIRELSSINKTKHVLLPKSIPSRLAYPYFFFSIIKILENSMLIENQLENVNRVINVLKHNKFNDITENIAEKLIWKIPIIYASSNYEVVALKWKLNFNENSEIPSFYNIFPSAMYNELACFSKASYSNNKDFYVLLIQSEEDNQILKKRSNIVKNILRESNIPVTEIVVTGDCYLVRLFSAMLIGDWLSYHLAIKKGIDPTPTKIVEEIKKRELS